MGIWHTRSKRSSTGKLIRDNAKRKQFQSGSEHIKTTIGAKKLKIVKGLGHTVKQKLRFAEIANLVGAGKANILNVLENKANPHFIRQNVITKGAIIETELGKAKVTSRPGQDGLVNAVLLEKTGAVSASKAKAKPVKKTIAKKAELKKEVKAEKKPATKAVVKAKTHKVAEVKKETKAVAEKKD